MIPRDIQLNDGSIRLRPPVPADAPALLAAVRGSLPELGPWLSWARSGYSADTARSWINSTLGEWARESSFGFLVTGVESGGVLGFCGLSRVDRLHRLANLVYWVRSDRRGCGIAPRSVRLAARFAFERLGLVRVEIVVAVDNAASLRVAEKVGATREGVLRNRVFGLGGLQDAVMHSLVPPDFGLGSPAPREPALGNTPDPQVADLV